MIVELGRNRLKDLSFTTWLRQPWLGHSCLAAEACRWEIVAQIAGELQRPGMAVDGGRVRAEELRLLVAGRRS